MSLDHGITLPVTDRQPIIDFRRTVLDAHPVGDLAQPSAFDLSTVLAAMLGLAEVPPQIPTPRLIIPDQGIDPLVTDPNAIQGRHEAADLLGTPLFTQPIDNGGDHTG